MNFHITTITDAIIEFFHGYSLVLTTGKIPTLDERLVQLKTADEKVSK